MERGPAVSRFGFQYMDPWLSSYEDLSDRYQRVPFRGIERKNFIRFETFRRMKILSPYGHCGVRRASIITQPQNQEKLSVKR